MLTPKSQQPTRRVCTLCSCTCTLLLYLHLPELVLCCGVALLHRFVANLQTDQLPLHVHPTIVHLAKEGIPLSVMPLPHRLQFQSLQLGVQFSIMVLGLLCMCE